MFKRKNLVKALLTHHKPLCMCKHFIQNHEVQMLLFIILQMGHLPHSFRLVSVVSHLGASSKYGM